MDRVSKLEREDRVCLQFFKFRLQLIRGESIFVQTIVPLDTFQDLQVSTSQPITRLVYHLDAFVAFSEAL